MLNATKIKAAQAKTKPYKMSDGNQLYLHVSAAGTKTFKLDYRLGDKRKTLVIGNYPGISLLEAREKANEARKQAHRGIDPNVRNLKKLNFKAIASEYCALKDWGAKHKQVRRLELYIYPSLGHANINDIEPPELLAIVRPIESSGTGETAHRVLNLIGQVYRYSISCGYAATDKSYGLVSALKPVKGNHFEAIVEPSEFKMAYKAFDTVYSPITRNALKMAVLTAARPGELRAMRWRDINMESATWSYLVSKTRTQHIVPLSNQAMGILDMMQVLTGLNDYVFVSLRGADSDRPISDTALLVALQRAGIKSTVHGFRSSFRTIMDEVLCYPPHLLEHQLAHTVKDPLGRAYNRTTHLAERRTMMQDWSDFLD